VGRCCRERQTSGASSQSRRERGVRRAAPAEGLRAGYERSRRAMGKRLDGLGRGSATPRGGRRCAAGSPPVLVAVGATLGGGEGSKVVLSTRNERGPGYQHPCPAREGARRGVCARSQKKKKKGKTKRVGGQGLPGRLSRNSFCSLLTEIYQTLYGSVIPLPAAVSISSWSQLICCDSCQQ
jgi:hypothetical protein